MDAAKVLKHAREIAELSSAAWAVTQDARHEMSARLVQTVALTEDWQAAFFTNFDTRKVREIESGGRMLMAYHWGEAGSYVTLSGEAQIVSEPVQKAQYWKSSLAEWYPKGPTDPDLALVLLQTDRIEVWSAKRGIMPGTGAAVLTGDNGGWDLGSTDRTW